MKSSIIGLLLIVVISSQAMGAQTVQEILSQNIGKVSGVVKDDPTSSCEFEVNDETLPGHLVAYAGIYANSTFMVFPLHIWELNESAKTLTYFFNTTKIDSVQMNYDAVTLKINSFFHFHKSGSVIGSGCLLK